MKIWIALKNLKYINVIILKIYKYNNYNTPPKPLFYTPGPA